MTPEELRRYVREAETYTNDDRRRLAEVPFNGTSEECAAHVFAALLVSYRAGDDARATGPSLDDVRAEQSSALWQPTRRAET